MFLLDILADNIAPFCIDSVNLGVDYMGMNTNVATRRTEHAIIHCYLALTVGNPRKDQHKLRPMLCMTLATTEFSYFTKRKLYNITLASI